MALRRYRKWLVGALAAWALGAAALWLLRPGGPPLTAELYQRLRLGMARAEAEALLGGPGGTRQDFCLWLNNRSPTAGLGSDLLNGQRDHPGVAYWYQDSCVIILRFDADGRVADKEFLEVCVPTARQRVTRLLQRVGW